MHPKPSSNKSTKQAPESFVTTDWACIFGHDAGWWQEYLCLKFRIQDAGGSCSLFWVMAIENTAKGHTLLCLLTSISWHFCLFSPDPEGIAAPTVRALSPYALHVTWTRPSTPNGVVTHYIIRVNDQQNSRNTTVSANAPFELNVTSLDPYILYNVIVSACTVGGCGSSSPSQVRTLPAKPEMQPAPIAEAESQTSLRVRWDAPLRPNGVILRYELFRRTVEDLVENNITEPTDYVKVFQSTPLVTEYLDTGLGIFSLHQYKVNYFVKGLCLSLINSRRQAMTIKDHSKCMKRSTENLTLNKHFYSFSSFPGHSCDWAG